MMLMYWLSTLTDQRHALRSFSLRRLLLLLLLLLVLVCLFLTQFSDHCWRQFCHHKTGKLSAAVSRSYAGTHGSSQAAPEFWTWAYLASAKRETIYPGTCSGAKKFLNKFAKTSGSSVETVGRNCTNIRSVAMRMLLADRSRTKIKGQPAHEAAVGMLYTKSTTNRSKSITGRPMHTRL